MTNRQSIDEWLYCPAKVLFSEWWQKTSVINGCLEDPSKWHKITGFRNKM